MDDDDLEGLEDEETPQPKGFAALPPETQAEIKKLRKENEGLRKERGTLRRESLTAKYGADIVELIPEEIASFEKQIEFADKLKAKLTPPETTETQPEETPAEAPQAAQVPEGLKAMTGSPPATAAAPNDVSMSAAELTALYKTDPAEATRLARIKFG